VISLLYCILPLVVVIVIVVVIIVIVAGGQRGEVCCNL
jgi:hypothetical protein